MGDGGDLLTKINDKLAKMKEIGRDKRSYTKPTTGDSNENIG